MTLMDGPKVSDGVSRLWWVVDMVAIDQNAAGAQGAFVLAQDDEQATALFLRIAKKPVSPYVFVGEVEQIYLTNVMDWLNEPRPVPEWLKLLPDIGWEVHRCAVPRPEHEDHGAS